MFLRGVRFALECPRHLLALSLRPQSEMEKWKRSYGISPPVRGRRSCLQCKQYKTISHFPLANRITTETRRGRNYSLLPSRTVHTTDRYSAFLIPQRSRVLKPYVTSCLCWRRAGFSTRILTPPLNHDHMNSAKLQKLAWLCILTRLR